MPTDFMQILDIRALIEILVTAAGCTIGAVVLVVWQRDQWKRNIASLEASHKKEMELRDKEWQARDRELQMRHNAEVSALRTEMAEMKAELAQEKAYRRILSEMIERQLGIKIPYPPTAIQFNSQGDIVVGNDVVAHDKTQTQG